MNYKRLILAVPIEKRFWEKVKKTSTCWNWIACKDIDGYGRFHVGPKLVGAHRYSYELHKATIPKDLVIDHLCRNHACVNPDHLEPVTDRENRRRGIILKGEQRPNSKLTAGQVLAIRRLALSSAYFRYENVALQFGINPQTVVKIINRTLWKHI